MSKIICDVCGTTYPETATQCPICGCVRPGEGKRASTNAGEQAQTKPVYTPVKGGRFSKANVKKRNANAQNPVRNTTTAKANKENHKDKVTRGLVVTAVVIVLAIIAVVVYICLKFFAPDILDNPQNLLSNSDTTISAEDTTAGVQIPCQSVSFDISSVVLKNLGDARMLEVTAEPEDTTDTLSFTSSDDSVIAVTQDGKVTAMSAGEATITVTCGDVSASCTVTCTYVAPTETTEATTEATEAEEPLTLNRSDISFNKKGESWVLYSGNISKTEITWSSDDTNIAVIDNGKVEAVGGGTTKVYGEYKGEKVSCIIRCNFAAEGNQGVTGNGGGITEDGGGVSPDDSGSASSGSYKLYNRNNPGGSAEDVSLPVGQSFSLELQDETGNFVDAVWTVADLECCDMSKNTFTGKSAGTTSITATYNGLTYTCVVRVY